MNLLPASPISCAWNISVGGENCEEKQLNKEINKFEACLAPNKKHSACWVPLLSHCL